MSTKKYIQLALTREQAFSVYDRFIDEINAKADALRSCGYSEIECYLDDLRGLVDMVDAIALALEENDEKEA